MLSGSLELKLKLLPTLETEWNSVRSQEPIHCVHVHLAVQWHSAKKQYDWIRWGGKPLPSQTPSACWHSSLSLKSKWLPHLAHRLWRNLSWCRLVGGGNLEAQTLFHSSPFTGAVQGSSDFWDKSPLPPVAWIKHYSSPFAEKSTTVSTQSQVSTTILAIVGSWNDVATLSFVVFPVTVMEYPRQSFL